MPPGTDAPATDTPTETTAADDTTKPTDTVEFWKSKAREQEKRAKANADAADRLAALEESQKTEAQKLADARVAAEKARDQAQAEALRWRIAAKHGITDEDAELFLTGTDADTLNKQAARLTARESDRKKNGNVVPREGTTATPQTNDMRDFARQLFDRPD